MSLTAQAGFGRQSLRLGLGVLCACSTLAFVQLLFIPRQPPLPLPLQRASLPEPWNSVPAGTVLEGRAIGPWAGSVAIGSSQRFSHQGTWFILTPVATWQLNDLDPAAFTKGIAPIELQRRKLLTLQRKRQQIAIGRINNVTAAQTCLTPAGTTAFSAGRLINLSRHRDPGFLARALQSLLPSSSRGYSCLLITTNNPSLLQDRQGASPLLKTLMSATKWPG